MGEALKSDHEAFNCDGKALKSMGRMIYGMHLRARRKRQGKRRSVNDGEALKDNGKTLSSEREALKEDGNFEGQWRGTADS